MVNATEPTSSIKKKIHIHHFQESDSTTVGLSGVCMLVIYCQDRQTQITQTGERERERERVRDTERERGGGGC